MTSTTSATEAWQGPNRSVRDDGALERKESCAVRLYRGLKDPYRPDQVRSRLKETLNGTDFTDCPFTALSYAPGRTGVVLVLDVPDGAGVSVSEEFWFAPSAKRLMVWGAFDRWLVAVVPAKRLRKEVHKKGMAGLPPASKGEVLKMAIARRLAGGDDTDTSSRSWAPKSPTR